MNIEMRNLTMTYPGVTLYDGLNLTLHDAETVCLLGPSGCGKTTLLRLLAGTLSPMSGFITPDVTGKISYLFQESRLLPWMTVLENTIYLMDERLPLPERRARGRHLLERVGLARFEHHRPRELSGGMNRRVALARMLGKDAALLLMDEPFLSLDETLRCQLVALTRHILNAGRQTALCVTHDVSVAEHLADRIIRLARPDQYTVIVSDRRIRV